MRDPELVMRAQRAAAELEQAWDRWRTIHGLGTEPLPPVSSYVGYSLEEPWGQPRVVFGIDAARPSSWPRCSTGTTSGPIYAAVASRPGARPVEEANGRPAEPASGRVHVPTQAGVIQREAVPRDKVTEPAPAESFRSPLEPPGRRDNTEPALRPAPDADAPDARGPEAAGEDPAPRDAHDTGNGAWSRSGPGTSPRRARMRARRRMPGGASRPRPPTTTTSRPRPGPGSAADPVATARRGRSAPERPSRPAASRRPRTARAWTPWPRTWRAGRRASCPDRRRTGAHLGRFAGKTGIRSVNLNEAAPAGSDRRCWSQGSAGC